ncbi:MAG: leucine-rich repeat domain-containing protein [Anaerohalosphaeraceae bacterium]
MSKQHGIVLGLILIFSVLGKAEEPVPFPDQEFKRAIEEALSLSNPTPSDMLKLTELSINGNIINISGIEFAKNLQQISLCSIIHDLTPLTRIAGLSKIKLSRYNKVLPVELIENELTVLPDLSELHCLNELVLEGTQIRDIHSISKLTSLTHLVLSCNSIDDLSPVSELKNLVCLKIDRENSINMPSLSNMSGLVELDIDEGPYDIKWLENATSLKKVSLCESHIRDISPLESMTQLTELNLSRNEISDISPLQNLQALQHLNLSFNQISDVSPLSGLNQLTVLSLHGNRIQDISPLANAKQLKILHIRYNPLTRKSQTVDLSTMRQHNPDMVIECDVDNANIFHDFVIPGFYLLYILAASWLFWKLKKAKKKKLFYLASGFFILSLTPLPVRPRDVETAVYKATTALIQDERVIVINNCRATYIPLYDSKYINQYRTLYYRNEIQVNNDVFQKLDLLAEPLDANMSSIDSGRYAIIEYTCRDDLSELMKTTPKAALHFNYYLGLLGAQGYRLILYRNLFGVHPIYIHEWSS